MSELDVKVLYPNRPTNTKVNKRRKKKYKTYLVNRQEEIPIEILRQIIKIEFQMDKNIPSF